jgi:hypothetical protein
MSRRNEGKTDLNRLKSDREKYLKDSRDKICQLEKILEILKERGFDDSLVQKLYKREIARNKRLTKLVEPDIKGE